MVAARHHPQLHESSSSAGGDQTSGGGSFNTASSFASLDQPPSCSSSRNRPSVLRPFRSLTSLQSSASTDEALAAMENTTLGPEPPPIDSPMMGQPLEGDVVPETGPDRSQLRTEWRSILVCAVLAFCSAVQYSLYFSSMWPYFKRLDRDASELFFGYIVASYSLGQILGSPVVGYLSNRFRKIRQLLYAGLFLLFAGNALYLAVHLFAIDARKYLLLTARFITGVGSSNISLLKAYASTASTAADRSRSIALVTGGVALGTTMGPAFQLLFYPFGETGVEISADPALHLSMYTAPALTACLMNVVNALAIWLCFRETYAGLIQSQSTMDSKKEPDEQTLMKLPKPDCIAMLLCYGTRFTQMFINTNLETLGAPLAMMIFAWTESQTVMYYSIAHGGMSLLSFITYIAFLIFRFDRIVDSRVNLMLSLFVLIIFHVLTYSYPFLPGHVQTFIYNASLPNHTEPVGCNATKFDWCDSVRPLSPWYFYACYILCIGLAFPNINITINTLFSKIIGPRRQGTQQGFLQMSGGVAKLVGPMVISALYVSFGYQSAWILEIAVTAITLLFWVILFMRMVPLIVPPGLLQPGMEKRPTTESTTTTKSTSSSRRSRKKSPEERRTLVEPIEEEPDLEENSEEEEEEEENEENGPNRLERHNATVSTVVSLVDVEC